MNKKTTKRITVLAAAMIATTGAFGALAHDGESHLDDMMAEAQLVFQGEVVGIEYALSQPSGPDGVRTPFTFVTYWVQDVLSGKNPGELLTLRFIGGLDQESQLVLRSSNAPQFDVGDQDILFVQGNLSSLVPLVGDEGGRLRIIDGQIYSEHGQEVRLGEESEILRGHRFVLEEVMTQNIGGQIFVTDLGPQAIDGASNAIGLGQMLAAIQDASEDLPRITQEIPSADPREPFAGPSMDAAAPPRDEAEGEGEGEELDAAEKLEREELEVISTPVRRK